MDALSSAVAKKVNCDLQLTLMANILYRLRMRLAAGPAREDRLARRPWESA